jgi:uncharacterized membrane protein YbhN (UPF0104 family)
VKSASRLALGRMLLGFVLSGLLLVLLLRAIDVGEVTNTLQEINTGTLASLLLIHLLILLLRVHRWQLIVEPETPPSWRARILTGQAVFVGWFTDSALPLKAGELTRPWVYAGRTGRRFADVLGTVVLERLLDLLTLFTLFTVAFAMLPGAAVPDWFTNIAWAGSGITALGLISTLALSWWGPQTLPPPSGNEGTLRRKVLNTLIHFRRGLKVFKSPFRTVHVLAWTIGIWALETAALSVTLIACGATFSGPADPSAIAASASQVVFSTLAVVLPQSPAGIGVDQWATILALRPFGIESSTATAVSIIDVTCVLFWVLPLGLVATLRSTSLGKKT